MATRLGSVIVKDLFGVNLEEQGRGFYVSLELFAIARGVLEDRPDQLLEPGAEPIVYRRTSHDLARRIAVGKTVPEGTLELALQDAETLETLHALMSSLTVEIPGRRRAPQWYAAHLYPFVGELVHYDAVERRGNPSIERYLFRDGGGWAYCVLRSDGDSGRRIATRDALKDLLGDSGTPLGRVAAALKSHDSAQAAPWVDTSEAETDVKDERSPWPEHLRRGVNFIVMRGAMPRAKRIESLMHWVPYCLGRHQLHLARQALGLARETVLIDATRDANPLRRRSQDSLNEFRRNIASALTRRADDLRNEALKIGRVDTAAHYLEFTDGGAGFTRSPRAFFSETLAAVGALNSTTGKRHFTLKPPLLEAVVAATLPPAQEEEYYAFCSKLFDWYALAIDERTAGANGFTTDIDGTVFAANASAFRERLAAIGLLTHYSDATSIVHGESR